MQQSIKLSTLFTQMLNVSQRGMKPVLERLAIELSLPVILTNPHYQLLLSSSPPEEANIQSILAISQLDLQQDSSIFTCQIITEASTEIGWGLPIMYANKVLGYLFILDKPNSTPTEETQATVEFAASVCAIQLYKKLEIRQEKLKFKEPFLFDLLYGNIKGREEIIEYGKLWDWDFTIPQTVIVFSLADFQHITTDKQLISNLLYITERTVLEQTIKPITMTRQSQVILLIPTHLDKTVDARAYLEQLASTVRNEMAKLFPERKINCGFGKTYANPVELFRSFQEAKIALELGHLLQIPFPFFSDLGLERILYKHDQQDLAEYYHTTLGKLVDYDEKHQSQLMETLEVYAAHQFEITATANALFLHRNTLRYRMKKIEEILGWKLDDLTHKLNITAAFKIKQLKKI